MAKAKKTKTKAVKDAPIKKAKKTAKKAIKKAAKKAKPPKPETAELTPADNIALENIALAVLEILPETLPEIAGSLPAAPWSISAKRFSIQEIEAGIFCCMEKIGNRLQEHLCFLDRNDCIAHIIDQHAGANAEDLRVTVGAFELKKQDDFYCCVFKNGNETVEHLCFISPKACIDHMFAMHG